MATAAAYAGFSCQVTRSSKTTNAASVSRRHMAVRSFARQMQQFSQGQGAVQLQKGRLCSRSKSSGSPFRLSIQCVQSEFSAKVDKSKIERKIFLGDGLVLRTVQRELEDGSRIVNIVATWEDNSTHSLPDLTIHWASQTAAGEPWKVPPQDCWPKSSWNHKNRAVRSKFVHNSVELMLPRETPRLVFLVFTDSGKWYKDNGSDYVVSFDTVEDPDDIYKLAEVAAYIRWENMGKPNLVEEESLKIFQEELAIIRGHLADGHEAESMREQIFEHESGEVYTAKKPKRKPRVEQIPEKLVEVRAYVRWEEGGKQQYSAEQQQYEFEQARKDLWDEVKKGASLEDLQSWLDLGPFGARPSTWEEGEVPLKKTVAEPSAPKRILRNQISRRDWNLNGLIVEDVPSFHGDATAKWVCDEIVNKESDAERSFMHRYNIAADLLERASHDCVFSVGAISSWMRYTSMRQLLWNRDYNVKPRELSAAQSRLTDIAVRLYWDKPDYRDIMRMMLTSVGRGGAGNIGQRIRDEILDVQRANNEMGGMMEEWHQKLHNNTTPDDVIICQALINYLRSDCDMGVYWETLTKDGISKERLASYDRPIVSEPNLRNNGNKGKLIHDLSNYLKTLKAVHSGAELDSAIDACLGYYLPDCKGASVHKSPIGEVTGNGRLADMLRNLKERDIQWSLRDRLSTLLECRQELRSSALRPGVDKDVLYLDCALEQEVRLTIEKSSSDISEMNLKDMVSVMELALENFVLSTSYNEELVYCLRDWRSFMSQGDKDERKWALLLKSVSDRISFAIGSYGEILDHILQDPAADIGKRLRCDKWAVEHFVEEVIRSGPAVSLSLVLRQLNKRLRETAELGAWQIISAADGQGVVEVVKSLKEVQYKKFEVPTILIAEKVGGEEEIPEGVGAVLTRDMPDVLSHSAVRARNEAVCLATCFDESVFAELQSMSGELISIEANGAGALKYEKISKDALGKSSKSNSHAMPKESITIEKRSFQGKFAVTWNEYESKYVGAKSRNVADLRGKLSDWIKLPASVAIPYGVFEECLDSPINSDVKKRLQACLSDLEKSSDGAGLAKARDIVRGVKLTEKAMGEIKETMKKVNIPMPKTEGEWNAAWASVTGVWASKWNDRAYLSCRKAGISHSDLCMSVLVQEIVKPGYAFVIHTVNPQTQDKTEVYAELVKGLGETLVGSYPGRALSFVAPKSNPEEIRIEGFPSKSVGLFVEPSLIFRSDSNGEDLEGYAGAGLYDSITMQEAQQRKINYAEDRITNDTDFQHEVLSRIMKAGAEIEKILGSPQDIEGVVTDDLQLYVVQTRPQM